MIVVTLTWEELETAWEVAVHRYIRIQREGRQHRKPTDVRNHIRWDIDSCPAELAVAKHKGLYWHGPEPYDPDAPDVGEDVEVKSSLHTDAHLVLYPPHKDDRRFFLVIPKGYDDPRVFGIVGWLYGKEGKVECYRREHPRPSYWIPQSDLRDPA